MKNYHYFFAFDKFIIRPVYDFTLEQTDYCVFGRIVPFVYKYLTIVDDTIYKEIEEFDYL